MVAAVVWGNVTGIHAATAAMDLVDTVITVGTTAFWSVKALTVLRLQEYNTVLFMIGFKCW